MMPTWRRLLEAETRVCTEHDLPHWHYIVLTDVQEHPGTAQHQVAARIVRSPSRLAADVELLGARRLLLRSSSVSNRRANRLTLTAEGEALVTRLRAQIHREEDRLLHRLTPREQNTLRNLLTRALDPERL